MVMSSSHEEMGALELGGVRWSWVGVLAQMLQLGDFGLIVQLLSPSLRFAFL